MAVDMSNVKQIMHNNKEVIKIEDSNGNVLWENKKSSTIKISIGAGQDINIKQSPTYIQIPPMPLIKDFIANKTGVGKERITLTDMKIDGSTLYWLKGAAGTVQPYLSFQSYVSSSTVYFGEGSLVRDSGIYYWFLSEVDLYDIDLKNDYPTILYGFTHHVDTGEYYKFGSTASFCTKLDENAVPTFTIVVTYETT